MTSLVPLFFWARQASIVSHTRVPVLMMRAHVGEEGGGGKVILLKKGAYEGMDACLMCHPAPGPPLSASLSACLAIQRLTVEFHGHTWVIIISRGAMRALLRRQSPCGPLALGRTKRAGCGSISI